MPKTIFIGSSSERKELAKRIAQELSAAGCRPVRWWEEFPPGSVTLDRLREIVQEVDGAVFVFGNEDRHWYRGEETASPRDNVVLEYGLFVSHLGRERTVLVRESDSRLPTDVSGITYQAGTADASSVAEQVVAHFTKLFEDSMPPPKISVSIQADPDLIGDELQDHPPDAWRQRSLYVGLEGARSWIAAAHDPTPTPPPYKRQVQRMIVGLTDGIDIRTFVSFGPGDAEIDRDIAIRVRSREPWLQYIPVDISDGLLQRALDLLGDQVRVPAGILGDFEDRLPYIRHELAFYARSPILFGLLGNTLGNLDNYEQRFLHSLAAIMRRDDRVLLEVRLNGPNWSWDLDRDTKHAGYGPGWRRFIATGIARASGRSPEEITAQFADWIRFEGGASDVPDASCITVVNAKSNATVLNIRGYKYDSLIEWLKQQGFSVDRNQQILEPDQVLGRAAVLLHKA